LDLTGTFDPRRFLTRLSSRRCGEVDFPHGWLTGLEKNDILRHQTQDRFDITRFARSHPGIDQLTYFLFVALHIHSSTMTPNVLRLSSFGLLMHAERAKVCVPFPSHLVKHFSKLA
jgi:hypothetical protein